MLTVLLIIIKFLIRFIIGYLLNYLRTNIYSNKIEDINKIVKNTEVNSYTSLLGYIDYVVILLYTIKSIFGNHGIFSTVISTLLDIYVYLKFFFIDYNQYIKYILILVIQYLLINMFYIIYDNFNTKSYIFYLVIVFLVIILILLLVGIYIGDIEFNGFKLLNTKNYIYIVCILFVHLTNYFVSNNTNSISEHLYITSSLIYLISRNI